MILITLLGAALRRYHIAINGLWYDELGEASVASRWGVSLLEGVRGHAGAAPLDYLGVKLVTTLFGHSTAATRGWPLLVGIATVPAVGLFAAMAYRRRVVGLTAAFLTATSPFLIQYSQEARFYALTTFIFVLVLLAMYRAMQLSRGRDWALFSLIASAALYTYYFLAVVLITCGIALAVSTLLAWRSAAWNRDYWRGRWLGYSASMAATFVSFVPWLLFAVGPQAAVVYPYGGPGPFVPSDMVSAVLAPASLDQVGAWWRPVTTACVCLAAVLGALRFRTRSWTSIALILTPVLLLPIVWLSDARSGYFPSPRQLIVIAPALYIMAAAGAVTFSSWATRGRPRAGFLALTVMGFCWAFLCSLPLTSYYAAAATSKPAWEKASDYVASRACADTTVYVNLAEDLLFGVGYHRPELVGRLSPVRIGPGTDSPSAVADLPLKADDIVVLWLNYFVTRRNSLGAITDSMATRGYGHANFMQIRVFAPSKDC